ncbi:MAG: hypothetical protein LQ350_003295 [Teloschistes chrysophthalmus]|nr:MAG: hypothetical protein LQ350_003295 [Niorma chrysophthalma]
MVKKPQYLLIKRKAISRPPLQLYIHDQEPAVSSDKTQGHLKTSMEAATKLTNLHHTFANEEGSSLLFDLKSLKDSVNDLNTKVTCLNTKVTSLESKVTELQVDNEAAHAQLELLIPNNLRFYAIRRRFLDVFKRDGLGYAALKRVLGNAQIKLGDEVAHIQTSLRTP